MSSPFSLTPFGGQLYFQATTSEIGAELYRYDPQTGEISLTADLREGPAGSHPVSLTPFGDELYFTADTPETGEELFAYDPRTGEASLVADIAEGPEFSDPRDFTPFGGPSRGDDDDPVANAPDDAEEAREVLSLAELLDDGGDLPVDGPAGIQPVTLDSATALGTGPSVEDLVATPENVVA